MNTARRIATLAAILCFVPTSSSAITIAELQAQVQALISQITTVQSQIENTQKQTPVQVAPATYISSICPTLSRSLEKGSRGDDVANLQGFLLEQGFFNAGVTAYFGAVTESSLKAWQTSRGLYASGVADEKTRAALTQLCGDSIVLTNAEVQACTATAPTRSCNGAWKPLLNARGCPTEWRCDAPELLTLPKTFSAYPYSGLAPLTVTFYASFLRGQTYSVDFGDGEKAPFKVVGCDGSSINGCPNEAKVTHTYATSSTYTAKFLSNVGSVLATTTITVAHTSVASPVVSPSALLATPLSGASPLRVSFSTQQPFKRDVYTGTNYYVEFGDGTRGYMKIINNCVGIAPERCVLNWNAVHTYFATGVYIANLVETVDCKGVQPCAAASQKTIATSTINVR